MDNSKSTKLAQDLAPLQQRIEAVKAKCRPLELALGRVEAELEAMAGDKPRYEALQEVCRALVKLKEQEAKELFWSELPEVTHPEESLERLCRLPEKYREQVEGKLREKADLQEQIKVCHSELSFLDGEVDGAYQREQKRQSAFVIERKVDFFPMRTAVMPWSKETEGERLFRKALLIALLLCLLFGGLVPLVNIPVPERYSEVVEIPERIAKLVKTPPVVEEAPPPPKVQEEEKKVEEETPKKKEPKPAEEKIAEKSVREKVRSKGVLAFKDSFKDLIVDTPAANAGANARIRKGAPVAAGSSSSRRSLVAMQATGSSGGINASVISRNIEYGETGGSGKKLSGVDFTRVESKVKNLDQGIAQSSGGVSKPGRTDEEIQIVFDRYKATLYRIYNRELRKNPTLRGNILLRLTIEPGGAVSACSVERTDLASPELVDKIVDRVRKFNFGPKKGVPKVTILYPIDFLPAK